MTLGSNRSNSACQSNPGAWLSHPGGRPSGSLDDGFRGLRLSVLVENEYKTAGTTLPLFCGSFSSQQKSAVTCVSFAHPLKY